MLDTDLPYIQPLLMWLRKDEKLKEYFTEKSFFMPKNSLADAATEAMKKDCPAPRALWILPGETVASPPNSNNCLSPGMHTFNILIMVQCIRDEFQIVKRNDDVFLEGQFMELAEIRKYVKLSVRNFMRDYRAKGGKPYFDNITWLADRPMYPQEGDAFLISLSEFEVKLL